jgi:integrase
MRAYGTIPGKLTVGFVDTVKKPGNYPDGGGLYLQVQGNGKSWLFRFSRSRFGGTGDRNMGLGSLRDYDLAEARERARQCRVMLNDGIDPIEDRKERRRKAMLEAARRVTFEHCVEDWMEHNSKKWLPNTFRQTKQRIRKFLLPKLGKLPVNAIDGDLVYDVIAPIWETKTPTARHVLGFLEGILHRAKLKHYRDGDNPADMKGPLGQLLNDYDSVHTVKHLRGLPYREIPAFVALNRAHRNQFCGKTPTSGERRRHEERPVQSYAAEFLLLTAVRTGQVVNAKWSEFENGIWTCHDHKTRKKVKQPYVIPLSDQAMEILDVMRARQREAGITSQHVFVHTNGLHYGTAYPGRRIAEKGIVGFIRNNLGRADFDPHGFRVTFSSWAHDIDRFSNETIEMAIGHKVGNQMAQIYNRDSKRIEPLRLLFETWAEFCNRTEPLDAKVIPLRNTAE